MSVQQALVMRGSWNPIAITLTRSGATATATTVSGNHGYTTGQTHTIAGAAQAAYNGAVTVTVTSPTTFTYLVTESPASPATGSPIIGTWYDATCLAYDNLPSGLGATTTMTTPSGNSLTNGDTITDDDAPQIPIGSYTVANRTSTSYTIEVPSFAGSRHQGSGTFLFKRTPPTISSITRSGLTATLTTSATHKINTGDYITTSGATQSEYNVVAGSVVNTGSTTLTYQVATNPVSPATGSITST